MSARSDEGQRETSHLDIASRPLLRESTIIEMHRVHAQAEELAHEVHLTSGRSARRRLREARDAERDLLRVLGFVSYEEFVSVVGTAEAEDVELDDETHEVVARERARVRELERVLGEANAEIERLRDRSGLVAAAHPAGTADEKAAAPLAAELTRDIVAELRALHERLTGVARELETVAGLAGEMRSYTERAIAEAIALRLEVLAARRHAPD
jgi:hypothetical protein